MSGALEQPHRFAVAQNTKDPLRFFLHGGAAIGAVRRADFYLFKPKIRAKAGAEIGARLSRVRFAQSADAKQTNLHASNVA